jgi:hypothetical protein
MVRMRETLVGRMIRENRVRGEFTCDFVRFKSLEIYMMMSPKKLWTFGRTV